MRIPLADIAAPGAALLNRVPFRFQQQVLAGQQGEQRVLVPADATIERMVVRFYPGPELNLLIDPYVERRGGSRQNLIHYIGTTGLRGDNDVLEFELSMPVRVDDTLVIFFHNQHATLHYHYTCTMELDFADGVWRWPARLIGGGLR